MKFTDDQQRVIDARNSNILVAAAAGSGKTAVLVERIIKKITDIDNPVDIDRLLIVTYTSAAAAQMRERISKAVAAKLEEYPDNDHLQRQSSLIHNAQITTIDSFCLFVIRNYFNEIKLDPGFRVADESEVKLLMNDVMDKLLEEAHTEPTKRFLRFVECYSTGTSEKKIEEAIRGLYNFAMSYPFPEEWLRERINDYELSDISELVKKDWFQGTLKYIKTTLKECEGRIQRCIDLASGVGGPLPYMDALVSDMELIQKLGSTDDYAKLYDLFKYLKFTELSRKKGDGVDPQLKEVVKSIRNEVKDSIKSISDKLFMISPQDTFDDMAECKYIMEELVELTLKFKEYLDNAKREKNIIDFTDMEHLALNILVEKDDNGNIIPRDAALEYQEYFEEIMVDEYQDANEVQELLIKSISGENIDRHNRFMVGDVKQSIYKFRLARPEIFMQKYDEYPINTPVNGNVRIDLSCNFRSRREVLDSANFICSQIMKKQVGNVEYDDKAALNLGAVYYTEPNDMDKSFEPFEDMYQTELLLVTEPSKEEIELGTARENSDYSEKEKEALVVASRIKEMVGRFPVTDADTGQIRPAKFSDIVILFRATSGWDEDFRRILMERGIPVHVTSKSGYFNTLEIQTVVNILRVLDNPTQDIPLFGILKIPYFGFTDEEIALIKCRVREQLINECKKKDKDVNKEDEDVKKKIKKLSIYEQMKLYCEIATDDEEAILDKLDNFFDTIDSFRQRVTYTPIKELIKHILKTTAFDAYVGAMPGGDQRKANLDLLLEKAGNFEKTSFYGLFHFIRYLETIQEQEVDFGEANILDENADVVRIMTIHKSKGLEFPICFVCGLSKQFNQMEMRQSIVMDVELGLGVDYIDPVMRIKRKTLRKNVVLQHMKEDTRGEDLRVLYVALTRAKEKLILTGYVKDICKKLGAYSAIAMEESDKLPYSAIMSANSYMDMIIASLVRHRCMYELLEECGVCFEKNELPYMDIPMLVKRYNEFEAISGELAEAGKTAMLEKELEAAHEYADSKLAEEINERLDFKYPFDYLEGLTVKTTVSELKKAAFNEESEATKPLIQLPEESYIPRFIIEQTVAEDEADKEEIYKEETVTDSEENIEVKSGQKAIAGTQYGTAVHKVMELLSFSKEYLEVDYSKEKTDPKLFALIYGEREKWLEQGYVTKADIDCVGVGKIAGFFKTELAKRMIKASEEHKLYKEQPFVLGVPANKLRPQYPESETVLIQGVIDVFFYDDDGGIILVDYKTDKVDTLEELALRYKTQLDYYQMALEQILKCKVKERYLYSFKLGKEIQI